MSNTGLDVVQRSMRFSYLVAGSAMLLAGFADSAQGDTMSASVGKPLLAAEHLLSAHKYPAALSEVAKADAAPDKTPAETLAIDQLRASIDAARGDHAAAAADYAALIQSGQLSSAQQQQMAEAEASTQYQAGNYAGAIATIKAYLGDDARFRPVLLQSYYEQGNCAALNGAVSPELRAASRSGHAPAQADLQMVADCYANTKDMTGYAGALIPLVQYYPSPTYWGDVLGLMQADPAYSDRLALDFFRLKQAVGIAATEPDYMEYAQEAAQQGLDNEAAKIMAAGQAAGVLGSGPDADRQTRLNALIAQRQKAAAAGAVQQIAQAQAAKDFPTLFDIGFNRVEGGDTGGLALMADAIRSGTLTQAPQAELEMGMAYAGVGQKAYAQAMWKAVPEGTPAGNLAKLWMLVK